MSVLGFGLSLSLLPSGSSDTFIGTTGMGADTLRNTVYHNFPLYLKVQNLLDTDQKGKTESPRDKIPSPLLEFFKTTEGSEGSVSPRSREKTTLVNTKTSYIKQVSKSLSFLLQPIFIAHEKEPDVKISFPYLIKLEKKVSKTLISIFEGIEVLLHYQKFSIRISSGRISLDKALENLTHCQTIKKLFEKKNRSNREIKAKYESTLAAAIKLQQVYFKRVKKLKNNKCINENMIHELDSLRIAKEKKQDELQTLKHEKDKQMAEQITAKEKQIADLKSSLNCQNEKFIKETVDEYLKKSHEIIDYFEIVFKQIDSDYQRKVATCLDECNAAETERERIKDLYLKKILINRLIRKIVPDASAEEEIKWSVTTPKKLLATYRYFMSPETLFENINLCIEDQDFLLNHKRTLIHVCRMWLRDPWNINNVCNPEILSLLDKIVTNMRSEIPRLLEKDETTDILLEEQLFALESMLESVKQKNKATVLPPLCNNEVLPNTFERLTLFSELSKEDTKGLLKSYQRQIYWMSVRLFALIPIHELVFDAKVSAEEKALYCSKIIYYTHALNSFSSFILQEILSSNCPKEITARFNFYCKLAYALMHDHNYFGVMSITSALNNSVISATVRQLAIKLPAEINELNVLIDPLKNQLNLRNAMAAGKKNEAFIPFLGIIQKDLATFQLGNELPEINSTFLISLEFDTGLIQTLYNYIQDIEKIQQRLLIHGLPKVSPLESAILSTVPLSEDLTNLFYEKAQHLKKVNKEAEQSSQIVSLSRSFGDQLRTIRRKSIQPISTNSRESSCEELKPLSSRKIKELFET